MLSGGALDRVAISTGGLSFTEQLDYRDPQFLPGGSKYGGLKMMIALGKSTALRFEPESKTIQPARVTDWLLGQAGSQ